ncbi:pentapeptide repeat-containing protein [Umezawaea tangerina]|nr:pentapeptide repeat-containing protein [Umezawaea tangerina]
MVITTLLTSAAICVVLLVAVLGTWAVKRTWLTAQSLLLVCAALLAVIAMSGATAWLLWVDGPRGPGEALKSGALTAGAVLALYGLWLNHRRHQVEEDRRDTERARYELEALRSDHDRERGAAERFARAIELLGDDADQVRVGAMHSLVGLVRGWPDLTQTVLDVLCSYLRRPFDHPSLVSAGGRVRDWSDPEHVELADRERQVRLTAQRQLQEVLSFRADEEADARSLDLTGATLDQFTLRDVHIGSLLADGSRWFGGTVLELVRASGSVSLRRAAVTGHFAMLACLATATVLDDAEFDRVDLTDTSPGRLAAVDTKVRGELVADRVRCAGEAHGQLLVEGRTSFRDAVFVGPVNLSGKFEGRVDFERAQFHNALRFDDFKAHGGLRFRPARLPQDFNPTRFFAMSGQEAVLPDGFELRPMGPGIGLGRVQRTVVRR